MALATVAPLPQYFDLDGDPLDGGKLYFGAVNQNPLTNPATVYWDAAATIPAAQPVRTVNGYTVRNGTPALLYAAADYSVLVQDRRGRQVVYAANSAEFSNSSNVLTQLLAFIANLASSVGSTLVGFLQSGVGSVLRTLQDRLRDDMHLTDKGTTADMLTALQDVGTDFAAGGHCQIEAGTWTLSGTFTFAGQRLHLQGKGRQVSIVSFNPGAADVALEINEPSAGGSNQGSIGGLGFSSANAVDKTAIRLVNVANWDIGRIGISTGAWQGDSIGIKTEGRQLLYIHDSEIACARPLVVGNNATFPTLSADHSLIERCELVGTSATRPVIEFEDGTTFANLTIRNCAIVKGQHGIYWNDTTSTGAGFALDIEDIRTEQALSAAAYSIYLASTAQVLQSVNIRNAHLDNGREGIYLRNVQRVTLENVTFAMGAGRIALDMTFVAGSRLVMINCFKQAGSTVTLTNARCVRRERITDVGFVEEWVFHANYGSGSMAYDAYLGGVPFTVAAGATQAFADNTLTGVIVISTTEDVSAVFEIRGPTNTTRELLDNAGLFSQTAGTANSVNVYWDGASNYVVQNNRAGTISVSVLKLGTTI